MKKTYKPNGKRECARRVRQMERIKNKIVRVVGWSRLDWNYDFI